MLSKDSSACSQAGDATTLRTAIFRIPPRSRNPIARDGFRVTTALTHCVVPHLTQHAEISSHSGLTGPCAPAGAAYLYTDMLSCLIFCGLKRLSRRSEYEEAASLDRDDRQRASNG